VLECRARVFVAAEPTEQLRPGRMQVSILAEVQALHDLERLLGGAGLSDRHGKVEPASAEREEPSALIHDSLAEQSRRI